MEIRILIWVDGKEIDLAPWAVSARTAKAKKASKPPKSLGLKPAMGE